MRTKSLMLVLPFVALSTNADRIKSQVYGYVEGYVEKVEKQPTRENGSSTEQGRIKRVSNAHEFQTPNINLMVKSTKGTKYSSFLNLSGADGEGVSVSNAWVEARIFGNALKVRSGKMYRPFGLYNEKLDAVPTYIGIEPPELFDGDHLLLTRTTNLMFHGETSIGENPLTWSLTTGNDERLGGEVPIGGDVRYAHYGDDWDLLVGTSFYFSNGATSGQSGGVHDWMEKDKYEVFGVYTELNKGDLKVQFAYYQADHEGTRDGDAIDKDAFKKSGLNTRQIQRFCDGDTSICDVLEANYKVKTWYLRAGYSFETKMGEFTPYLQWDFYENPETIAAKSVGGDNEAGLADDGKFTKQTLGVVFRPDNALALKLDTSNHSQKIDGENSNYAEVRGSFSYIWSL